MMLEQAAATTWGVDVSECKALNHEVVDSSGKKFGSGDLTEAASKLSPPPEDTVVLKKKSDWKYIGKHLTVRCARHC